jgi:hypothetical protein
MDPSLLGVMPGTTSTVDLSSAYPFAGSTGIAAGTGTSQHGIAPLLSGNGGTVSDAINGVWAWLNQPFNSRMSFVTVFGYVGAIIVAIILWNLILYHVRIAAETI